MRHRWRREPPQYRVGAAGVARSDGRSRERATAVAQSSSIRSI
ncbi:MAG: hypothetical protein OJF58_003083 [Enhydrobacter sp.]|nr:MAG: hypothetical protein OJF58_003083 [Enhydrobacter sp.]